jgi:hypothetical protein
MPIVRLAAPAVLAALFLAVTLPARAAVVIEGKDGDETQRIVMEGSKLRMEGKDQEGKSVMIYDGDAKRSVQLHPDKKSYLEFTQSDLKKMAAMVKDAREKQGATTPNKAREPTHYEKTGRTDQALGKKCDVYAVKDDGKSKDEEMCIVPFGTFGVQKQDFAALRAFGDFAADLAGGGEVDRSWADLPGVPVASWRLEGGERRESFRATRIEKVKVPASEFAVPPGWTKEPGFSEQMEALQKQMGGEKK